MAQKTPISQLYEECTRKNCKPQFIEVHTNSKEIPEYLRSFEKKFWIKCIALGTSAIEGGPTKKSAQHSAAQKILEKYARGNDDEGDDDEVEEPNDVLMDQRDYVTDLLNLCVQKNYHKPEFVCVDQFGPSHDMTFVFECHLRSIVSRVQANSKNRAKQMAAKEVYEILIEDYPDIEKKVALVNQENLIRDETRKKITTYMELRKLDKTDKMGTTIADRCNFFIDHINQDFIDDLKKILQKNIDVEAKYYELVKEIETMWPCVVTDFLDSSSGWKQFECLIDFDQFTVFLVEKEEDLKKAVVEYFQRMLKIKQLDI